MDILRKKADYHISESIWNGFLALYFDAFLIFALSTFINLTSDELEGNSAIVNYIAAWICVIVLIFGFPIFISVFYFYHFDKLRTEEFSQKYDSIYINLNIKKRKSLAQPPL